MTPLRILAAAAVLTVGLATPAADAHSRYATRATARQHPGCQLRYRVLRAVGATHRQADWLAYVVSPGESGCTVQAVYDHDDASVSTYGLNGKGALGPAYKRGCGRNPAVRAGYTLTADSRCALWALRAFGPRAWSLARYGRP